MVNLEVDFGPEAQILKLCARAERSFISNCFMSNDSTCFVKLSMEVVGAVTGDCHLQS